MNAIHLQDNLSKAPLAGREQGIQQASADFGQRHGAQELNRQHALQCLAKSISWRSQLYW